MSNRRKDETPWPATMPSRDGSRGSRQLVEDAERELVAAETAYAAVTAAGEPEGWEARRRDLEQAIAVAARTLDAALRAGGPQDLGALELRLAALVGGFAELRPPASYGPVAFESELCQVLAAPLVGGAHDGYARKEAALDELLRLLSVADSRALVARIEKPHPEDALATGFRGLATERRARLLATLRGAARREAQAGEAARRAVLAAARAGGAPAKGKP